MPTPATRRSTVSSDIVRVAVRLLSSVVQRSEDDIALMAAWSSGEYRNEPVMTMSAVDLRNVRDFDRLADLAQAGYFLSLALTPDLPDRNEVTHLARLLNDEAHHSHPPRRFHEVLPLDGPNTRSSPVESNERVGRNAPCPCGSGRKYKRCCGHRAR